MAPPVDNGRTETVQHHVSKRSESHNVAPVFHAVPVQLPSPASPQSSDDSSPISYAGVSVLQPDRRK